MNIISWFFWYLLAACSYIHVKAGGGGGGKHTVKFIIPQIEKTIKHTHTIYKTIHHGHGGGGGGGGSSLGHSHGGTPHGWDWH